MNAQPHAPPLVGRSNLRLWAGLLAGPVAWLVQLQAVYALAQQVCLGLGAWTLHAATLACLLPALGGCGLAWSGWGAAGRHWPSDADEGKLARVRFLSVLGLLTGALFSLLILAQWIAVWLLDPCP